MSYPTNAGVSPDIAATLPPRDLLRQVLASNIIELSASTKLIRAAWNLASVWPDGVTRTYRFGPHDGLKTASGYPFYWIYAAEETLTAVWEAQFCTNPATHPGHFTVQKGAEEGKIATLAFNQRLRFFDLSGAAVSRLGIFDQLRSPDYQWCQVFGVVLDELLAEHGGEVHDFVYPSRRHPGALAYALSSRVRDVLARNLTFEVVQFGQTAAYANLLVDPSHLQRTLL
jgi:hypothetical protein